MIQTDILIIGAGAAGLMAARELARAGKKVIVVEARARIGGRILTLEHGFLKNEEAGAEFIHGNLPVTMSLLKEAGIEVYESGGQSWQSVNGEIKPQNYFIKNWDLLIDRLMEQKKDMSIAQFLQENFAGDEYEELRTSVTGFVEGYDAADTTLASIFALREEWTEEEELTQYRPIGAYKSMITYLEQTCKEAGVEFYLSHPIQSIHWEKDKVQCDSLQHTLFTASKVIITVPLGVLKSTVPHESILFKPSIPNKIKAADEIGFGAVIKFLVLFNEPFWENYRTSKGKEVRITEMGFVFANSEIPTWWTQFPKSSTLLTGWLAGPKAEKRKEFSATELKELAITSLSEIFLLTREEIKNKLVSIEVINWAADPYSRGAYAYTTLDTNEAREELTTPEKNTIYFAGEALYEGPAMGTVEAALASGLQTARQILNN